MSDLRQNPLDFWPNVEQAAFLRRCPCQIRKWVGIRDSLGVRLDWEMAERMRHARLITIRLDADQPHGAPIVADIALTDAGRVVLANWLARS
jgi:hypothetical protein